jgi:protein TonB
MVGTRQTLKIESTILPATAISILFHCLIAALLIFCLKESRHLPLQQMIISVDIRALEPEIEEKPRVTPQVPAKPARKMNSRPLLPVRTVQEPAQKTEAVPQPAPRPVPSQAAPAGSPPLAQPIQGKSESTAKSLSMPIPGLNLSRADTAALPVKGAPSPPAGTVDVKREQAYLASLKEIIERNKEYPFMARKGGMEGTVRIRCALLRNGELRDAAVIKPSGYTILDNAALRAVRSAGRFPVVPAEIKGETFSFVAPITFRLAAD